MKILENKLLNEIVLGGIKGITKVFVEETKIKYFDKDTGAFNDKTNEWELLTEGTNLKKVFQLEKCDFRRVTSNDIIQIYENLGVEALRLCLIKELKKVLGHYGIYVNYRHLACLCDVMTQGGYITAITRFGINKLDQGPLRKCSFEETVEILLEAGLFAEVDELKGISENIIVGQLAPFGTGSFDLIFDIEKVKNADFIEEANYNEDDEYLMNESTPSINNMNSDYSPNHISRTPFIGKTPITGNNYSSTPMSIMRQSPMFTPNRNTTKTPLYSINNYKESAPVVNITSPFPYNRGATSPGYNPSERAYSPTYDSDSKNYQDSDVYSPRHTLPTKSPNIYYGNNYNNSSSYPYSPSNNLMSSRHELTSPSYGNSINNKSKNLEYSPTTPLNNLSPDYGKNHLYSLRSSSYSNVNSPNVGQSPNSPTYNPKSPAYVNSVNFRVSSPFYDNDNNNNNTKKSGRPLSPILSDDESDG